VVENGCKTGAFIASETAVSIIDLRSDLRSILNRFESPARMTRANEVEVNTPSGMFALPFG
jgi:hypothetical protein